MAIEVPDSCTLPTAARPARLAEFAALLATAREGRRVDRGHVQLVFPARPGLAPALRDLTAREGACCAFFAFDVSAVADQVILDVRVPATHAGVLDGLADLVDWGPR